MKDRHLSVPAVAIAGWLFADLLLAFLIITLGMDAEEPPEPPEAVEEVPEPELVGLALEPVVIEMEGVSPSGAAAGDEEVVRELREAFAEHELEGREAGMVLTFGANGGAAAGERFAQDVNALLPEASPEVFEGAATRNFHSLGGAIGWLQIEVYLFTYDETPDT